VTWCPNSMFEPCFPFEAQSYTSGLRSFRVPAVPAHVPRRRSSAVIPAKGFRYYAALRLPRCLRTLLRSPLVTSCHEFAPVGFGTCSGKARAGHRGGFWSGVSLATASDSWNIVDLPGFRAVLFTRAKVCHAAGAAPSSPSQRLR